MKTFRFFSSFFIAGTLFSSCNFEQFLEADSEQVSVVDSIKMQNDSLLKIVQQHENDLKSNMGPKDIYSHFVKSTVTIVTDRGIGSGFYISRNLIATNYHVIEGASQVGIFLKDGEEVIPVEGYVAINKSVDLVILKTNIPGEPIPLAKTPLAIGDRIFAIGSPKGLNATISEGIISAKRSGMNNYFIQITAAISPGSSGGPVINQRGEVIGVSVMQVNEGQNLNFAIPAPELEILSAFKSELPRSISDLMEPRQVQNYSAQSSVATDSPIKEQEITEWNEDTRVEFIRACLDKGDPENELPGMFEFCDCVYQKITSRYAPNEIGNLTKQQAEELAESCALEME